MYAFSLPISLSNGGVLNNNECQEQKCLETRSIQAHSGRFKKACPEPVEGSSNKATATFWPTPKSHIFMKSLCL